LLFQFHLNNFKVSFLLFPFLDFPGTATLPEYLHVEVFTKSCFVHPVYLGWESCWNTSTIGVNRQFEQWNFDYRTHHFF